MSSTKMCMGAGMPAMQALAVAGVQQLSQTATGNSQGTAFTITAVTTEFTTTAASTGAILPGTTGPFLAGDCLEIFNMGASTLTVYPPVGFAINGGSTNAGVSVTTLKGASFFCRGDGNWFAQLSA